MVQGLVSISGGGVADGSGVSISISGGGVADGSGVDISGVADGSGGGSSLLYSIDLGRKKLSAKIKAAEIIIRSNIKWKFSGQLRPAREERKTK